MRYCYFWKGIYSNWFMSSFVEDDINYSCVEQYMMAKKALLFGDNDTYLEILESKTPREYKYYGRLVSNFDQDVWDKNKNDIVYTGLKLKFLQNKDLYKKLVSEDCDLFVEASPYDKIWGIGISKEDAIKGVPWNGKNLLGNLLTILRSEFKANK